MRLLVTVAGMLAMAIALNITMLAPAVASRHYCRPGTLACACASQCAVEQWNTAKLWDRNSFIQNKPLRDACRTKCAAAKKAAQH
jgi:hypothetical protein